MKKNIILILTPLIALFLYLYLYNSYQPWTPFRCDTQLKSHIAVNDKENLDLNLHITIVFIAPEKGELIAKGSLKGPRADYIVSRKVLFIAKDSGLQGVDKTIITSEVLHPIDNVPETLWRQYIMPENIGVEFYLKVEQLNKNAVLIAGLSNPHFVCTRSYN